MGTIVLAQLMTGSDLTYLWENLRTGHSQLHRIGHNVEPKEIGQTQFSVIYFKRYKQTKVLQELQIILK